jgi:hypothetical protein
MSEKRTAETLWRSDFFDRSSGVECASLPVQAGVISSAGSLGYG